MKTSHTLELGNTSGGEEGVECFYDDHAYDNDGRYIGASAGNC